VHLGELSNNESRDNLIEPITSVLVAPNLFFASSPLFFFRYVKREIRTLTIDDRERFLDAAAAVWKYSQSEGEALFGSKYTSIGDSTVLLWPSLRAIGQSAHDEALLVSCRTF
jgi:hypothetical protein